MGQGGKVLVYYILEKSLYIMFWKSSCILYFGKVLVYYVLEFAFDPTGNKEGSKVGK
jgi:hypothetical protein